MKLFFSKDKVKVVEEDGSIYYIKASHDRFVLQSSDLNSYFSSFRVNKIIIYNCNIQMFIIGTMNYVVQIEFEKCNIKTVIDYNNYYTYLSYNADHIKRVYRNVFYTDNDDIYIGLVENKTVKRYMISMSI